MNKTSFGVIGLGVMGKSLALNILDKGHSLSVYNRLAEGEETLVSDFLQNSDSQNLQGFTNLSAFVESLEAPRKILMMIKAGSVVDYVIDSLTPLLSKGDILIDGGNSHFDDTKKRNNKLSEQGFHFVGCGISGGEEGARKGPSMMPGGPKGSYQQIANVLESIAARDANGNSCCTYIGPDGAGHFVKMIHNGIEYAEMQLLAEAYQLLKQSHSNEEIADILDSWNTGDLASYLLEITANILRKKEGDGYLLDLILDQAANKGTGSWSSQTALQLGMPTTMMTDAVFARYVSSFKDMRVRLNQNRKKQLLLSSDAIEKAYRFARILNHQQGFSLIARASAEFDWKLNLSEVARVWTNGCIIRSAFMENLIEHLKTSNELFDNKELTQQLSKLEESASQVLSQSIEAGIPLPTISSSYQYWLGMTTGQSSANLIQAQRDYFGAHTYKRVDADTSKSFHTNWDS